MAARGMFNTTDLIPGLTERGIELSREQVYRLVTRVPERLNTRVLAALCDLLECTVGELVEPITTRPDAGRVDAPARGPKRASRSAGEQDSPQLPPGLRPTRARVAPVRPVE